MDAVRVGCYDSVTCAVCTMRIGAELLRNACLPHRQIHAGSIVPRQDLVDVEQDFDAVADLAHPENEVGVDGGAELRGLLDVFAGDVEDFLDTVHDNAHVGRASFLCDLDDDDAGLFRCGGCLHAELGPKVNHRNDLPAKVDHPFDIRRCPRYGGDVHVTDDLADLEDFQAELLVGEGKGEILALLVRERGARPRVLLFASYMCPFNETW